MTEPAAVTFTYTNWHGETAVRRVLPTGLIFAANEWHPEPQWLLRGFDLDKEVNRTFAMKDITGWADAD